MYKRRKARGLFTYVRHELGIPVAPETLAATPPLPVLAPSEEAMLDAVLADLTDADLDTSGVRNDVDPATMADSSLDAAIADSSLDAAVADSVTATLVDGDDSLTQVDPPPDSVPVLDDDLTLPATLVATTPERGSPELKRRMLDADASGLPALEAVVMAAPPLSVPEDGPTQLVGTP